MCVLQIFGSRVRVDSTAKVAEIEMAEKEKMKEKVERILKHGINCFINRCLDATLRVFSVIDSCQLISSCSAFHKVTCMSNNSALVAISFELYKIVNLSDQTQL